MAFTEEVKDSIKAAMPSVEFNGMHIFLEKHETVVRFTKDGKIVRIKRCPVMFSGDELRMSGFNGVLPLNWEYTDQPIITDDADGERDCGTRSAKETLNNALNS